MHAAGASETEAAVIARHLIEANLAGHDSHGVINISMYIDFMKKGHMIPGAKFEILEESATTPPLSTAIGDMASRPANERWR